MTQMPEWNTIKQKIKAKFGKFNDSEIEELNGHLERLPGKVERLYGYSKAKAQDECKEFISGNAPR